MKKKLIGMSLSLSLLMTSLAGCAAKDEEVGPTTTVEEPYIEIIKTENASSDVEFVQSTYEPEVEDYTINDDLSNITNLEYFGEFSPEETQRIVEDGFLIADTFSPGWMKYEQMFHLYDDNHYSRTPSFVTTDSMMHIFHIFFDGMLRDLEENSLYPVLVEFTTGALKSAEDIYNDADDKTLQELQINNLIMLCAGAKILDLNPAEIIGSELYDKVVAMLDIEMENIENLSSSESQVTGEPVDYSQLTPRGHYTRSETLEKYFKAVMYYSQIALFPFDNDGAVLKDNIKQSILLTKTIADNEETLTLWHKLTDPIETLVDSPDDLSIDTFMQIDEKIFDNNIENLQDGAKIKMAVTTIESLPEPKVAGFRGHSFRLLPQRAVIDSVYAQNLVDVIIKSQRPIYSGLDIMASFGNKTAKEILEEKEYYSVWAEYPERLEQNIEEYQKTTFDDWSKNVYRGWLWTLQGYNEEFKAGYPKFMQSDNWKIKDLISALGSFAEIKHDTVLYGKQVMAQMGGGGGDMPKGYVEPNVEVFDRLVWLLDFTKVNLEEKEIITPKISKKLDDFSDMVQRLRTIAIKQLENQPITDEEYQYIDSIGGYMEEISISFVENDLHYWYEIESDTDRRMPVVVDLMEVVDNTAGVEPGKYQTIASGYPLEIYVVYPIDGELKMGRGAIFSYAEFLADERMTDEKWQESLLEKPIAFPDWYSDLVTDPKDDVDGAFWDEEWEDFGY